MHLRLKVPVHSPRFRSGLGITIGAVVDQCAIGEIRGGTSGNINTATKPKGRSVGCEEGVVNIQIQAVDPAPVGPRIGSELALKEIPVIDMGSAAVAIGIDMILNELASSDIQIDTPKSTPMPALSIVLDEIAIFDHDIGSALSMHSGTMTSLIVIANHEIADARGPPAIGENPRSIDIRLWAIVQLAVTILDGESIQSCR